MSNKLEEEAESLLMHMIGETSLLMHMIDRGNILINAYDRNQDNCSEFNACFIYFMWSRARE